MLSDPRQFMHERRAAQRKAVILPMAIDIAKHFYVHGGEKKRLDVSF
jgi:hypothetical protein